MNAEQGLKLERESAVWQLIRIKITDGVWGRSGLCAEIHKLFRDGYISNAIKEQMRTRLERHRPLGAGANAYWWPSSYTEPRIEMCRRLEEESQREEILMAQAQTVTSRFTTTEMNETNIPRTLDDLIYRRVYNIQGTQDWIEVVFNKTKGYVTIDDNKLTTKQLGDLVSQLSNALSQIPLDVNIERSEITGDTF